jgi:long-chain acyl-CoA synthetase
MLGVPTMYSAMNGSQLLEQYDLSSLRYCISGGASLSREIQETFERLTGCSLVEGYGLTEAGPVCTINPFGAERRVGSIGLPLPGTIVEIVSLDDGQRRLPPGQRGEICITGPQLMAGYAERPEETADALRGGRLHTGDVGYMDQDGYVYLVDRVKDLILNGGFNVYPRMVEEAIVLHPAVEEATVCGVPDRHRGEIVKAYVKLRDGQRLTVAELRGFLRDKLAPFEQPKQIEFRHDLPRSWLGKPSRRTLIAEEMRRLNAEQPSALERPLASAVPQEGIL